MTTRTEVAQTPLGLLRNPSLWPIVPGGQLVKELILCCLLLGSRYSKEFCDEISGLYFYIAEKTTAGLRINTLNEIIRSVDARFTGHGAICPFLFFDEDISVISTAALAVSVLRPVNPGEDILAGPRSVLSLLDRSETENSTVGILQGLLLLGDRRVQPLLDQCWERLSRDGREKLWKTWNGFVYASFVDFLVGWLEQTKDDHEYASIAGTLAGYPVRDKNVPFIIDCERKFPANGPGPEPAVKHTGRWTFPEYGQILRPRLKAIEATETGEKVIPILLNAWEIS